MPPRAGSPRLSSATRTTSPRVSIASDGRGGGQRLVPRRDEKERPQRHVRTEVAVEREALERPAIAVRACERARAPRAPRRRTSVSRRSTRRTSAVASACASDSNGGGTCAGDEDHAERAASAGAAGGELLGERRARRAARRGREAHEPKVARTACCAARRSRGADRPPIGAPRGVVGVRPRARRMKRPELRGGKRSREVVSGVSRIA